MAMKSLADRLTMLALTRTVVQLLGQPGPRSALHAVQSLFAVMGYATPAGASQNPVWPPGVKSAQSTVAH